MAQQRGGRAAQMIRHEGCVLAAQPPRQQVLHRESGRVELGGGEHEAHGEHQVGQREGDLGAVHRAAGKPARRGPPPSAANRPQRPGPVGARWRGAPWETESLPSGHSRGALGDGVPRSILGNEVPGPLVRPPLREPPLQFSRGFGFSTGPAWGRCCTRSHCPAGETKTRGRGSRALVSSQPRRVRSKARDSWATAGSTATIHPRAAFPLGASGGPPLLRNPASASPSVPSPRKRNLIVGVTWRSASHWLSVPHAPPQPRADWPLSPTVGI